MIYTPYINVYAADCGTPILAADHSIVLMYNLTLEGSLLMFWCEESPYNVVTSLCHRNASWYPNPSDEDCSINMPGIMKYTNTQVIYKQTLLGLSQI